MSVLIYGTDPENREAQMELLRQCEEMLDQFLAAMRPFALSLLGLFVAATVTEWMHRRMTGRQ